MQDRDKIKVIKAAIYWIIVAFLIVVTISVIVIRFGKEKFRMAINLMDMIAVDSEENENTAIPTLQEIEEEEMEENIEDNGQTAVLLNCPSYGEKYATLKIPSIDIELPIFYGKTLDLLKNGIGHDNDSYFPGEGGSIILMGHNFSKFLGRLPNAKIGEQVQIITNYGEFNYTIYDTQIVNENDTDKVPIQEGEEKLMIYTCWPINNIGYATERYVVYAK